MSTAGTGALDVNDVSVLYPPAGSLNHFVDPTGFHSDPKILEGLLSRGYWPNLVRQGDQGFLDLSDFNDIIASAPRAKTSNNSGKTLTLFHIESTVDASNAKDPSPPQNLAPVSLGEGEERKYKVTMDLAEPGRWRVVSARIDPCPYKSHQGANKDSPGGGALLDSNVPPENCKPELRIVAQPALGGNPFEAAVGVGLPDSSGGNSRLDSGSGLYFADYAVHLFFELSQDEFRSAVSALQAIKEKNSSRCGTSGRPLGVHPCLVREMYSLVPPDSLKEIFQRSYPDDSVEIYDPLPSKRNDEFKKYDTSEMVSSWRNIQFAADFKGFLSKYTKKANKAAFFVSTRNQGPWMFFLLDRDIKTGKLFVNTIPALVKERPGSDEKADVQHLRTGRMQLVTRGSGLTGDGNADVDRSSVKSTQPRFSPAPKPTFDSLDLLVRTSSGFQNQAGFESAIKAASQPPQGLHNIRVDSSRPTTAMQILSRIENPFFNTEFTTDCGSCHLANTESATLRSLHGNIEYETEGWVGPGRPFSDFYSKNKGNDIARYVDFYQPETRFQTPSLEGVTPITRAAFQTTKNGAADDVYVFNQFSIYRDGPIVSNRVLNESMLSAYLVNKWYRGGAKALTLACDTQLLRHCAQGILGTSDRERHNWLASEMTSQFCFREELKICRPQN